MGKRQKGWDIGFLIEQGTFSSLHTCLNIILDSIVHNSKIERCLSKQNLYILNVQAFVNKERQLYPERQSVNQSGNLQTK